MYHGLMTNTMSGKVLKKTAFLGSIVLWRTHHNPFSMATVAMSMKYYFD